MLNTYEVLRRWTDQLAAWLAERWSLGSEVEPWMALLALAVVLAAVLIRPAWVLARNAVTVVHEMGHVVVARLCGRRIQGIRLHTDTSGLAITRGRPRGVGMALTALAGYPAPGLAGLVMAWAATTGRAGGALLLLEGLLLVTLALVRNAWGLVVVVVALLGTGVVLLEVSATAATAAVLVLGLFLATGSLRAACDLCAAHRRGDASQSDAVSVRDALALPAPLSLALFVLVTCACAAASLWTVGAVLVATAV